MGRPYGLLRAGFPFYKTLGSEAADEFSDRYCPGQRRLSLHIVSDQRRIVDQEVPYR